MAGRPITTIDDYFDDINTMYSSQGLSPRVISERLRQIYGITINYSTLARRIQEWGLEKGQVAAPYDLVRDQEVAAFVRQEWRQNCSHEEILRNLSIAMPHSNH
jgi:hypothetical protein